MGGVKDRSSLCCSGSFSMNQKIFFKINYLKCKKERILLQMLQNLSRKMFIKVRKQTKSRNVTKRTRTACIHGPCSWATSYQIFVHLAELDLPLAVLTRHLTNLQRLPMFTQILLLVEWRHRVRGSHLPSQNLHCSSVESGALKDILTF